ncbi:hypothetical protein TRAPUB_3319 [Trametes pubescens]|uniref:Uncharacterized protein n=1 Tax=Trametes pubescens TaxID=154538 RepID=A0A1M2VE23_TRAPU|nr:hypothetical protein TRAPUB_3319 [Trametes pubescens]
MSNYGMCPSLFEICLRTHKNPTAASERQADQDFSYKTGNYPPANDTTSSGGYGSADTFSPHSQRHADPVCAPTPTSPSDTGLIDQSPDGGPLGRELQDAKQGTDPRTREAFAHEARRDFAPGPQGLNPYGENPDSRGEAAQRLAATYADQRAER